MRSRRPELLLATASAAVALAAADTYVVVLALTDMMNGVGLGIDALQRATPIISGFLLGYVAVLPLIGRIADLVDRRRVLFACLAIFTVGSAMTALATDLPVLVGGRVVQGVGGGGLVPATLALVADLWPAGRRGIPLGVVGGVQELGSVLGPVLGAAVLAVASWRAIFWINAGLAVLLAVVLAALAPRASEPVAPGPRSGMPPARLSLPPASWVVAGLGVALLLLALWAPDALALSVDLGGPFVPLTESGDRLLTPVGLTALGVLALAGVLAVRRAEGVLRRADLPGALLVGGALGCVVLTFAAADPEREVVGPLGLALLPVGAVLAAGYLWHHRRAAYPLVPRGLVRGRMVPALVVSACTGVALVAVVVDVPLLARLVLTSDQGTAALVLVRFLVAVPVGALLGGVALRRFGDGMVAAAGLALATAGLAVMTSWGRGSLDAATSTVTLLAVGLGVGLALAPVNNAALAGSADDAHGAASALVVVARMVGMVVGIALLTALGLRHYYETVAALPPDAGTAALVDAAITQVHWIFAGAAVAAGVGALVALTLLRARPTPRPLG